MRKYIFFLAAFLVLVSVPRAWAQDSGVIDAQPDATSDGGQTDEAPAQVQNNRPPIKLVVATKSAPPFSIRNEDGTWTGLSIELWKRIADELDYEFEIRETDLSGMIAGLQDGSYDAAVAAITVTADREASFDFSHPFYTTGLGIAINPEQSSSWLSTIADLFSWRLFRSLGVLMLILLAVGIIVWFFERKQNDEQFGGSVAKGIGAGFWWSAVTMTTVGYGDKSPVTIGGRFVGLVWMFVSIVTISGITGAIASALTVSQLGTAVSGPEDLPNFRVGTVRGTTSAVYLRESQVVPFPYETVADGVQGVADGEIDAMVYDAPILQYLSKLNHDEEVTVLGETFERQDYAIGLPPRSTIREDVNRVLLEKINSDWWDDQIFEYLGR